MHLPTLQPYGEPPTKRAVQGLFRNQWNMLYKLKYSVEVHKFALVFKYIQRQHNLNVN